MAEAAVSAAVQILGNLLIEKVNFLGAVRGEVEWLKDELKTMHCFLKHAVEKQGSDERVRNWISQIREVAHDAKDVMEIFVLNVESRGERCPCFPMQVCQLDRVGVEIQSIRRRLEAIKESRETYGIKDLGERVEWSKIPDHVEWQRRLAPMERDADVVGLEKDVEALLEKEILDERKGLWSATITGMPGIGKSTLARIAYNHGGVVGWFDCRA